AISEAIAAELRERGVDDERLAIIRSAVDSAAFSKEIDRQAFLQEFSLSQGQFVIAAAGQLIPRKGHRFLLQAVADLKVRYAQLRLVIFGEGFLNTQLREQAASLGLGDVVQFAGFRDDLDQWLAGFDVFAHPALAEGLGVAALKAAAAGLPVVGFAAGGMVEAVAHEQTGILVPPADVDALGNAIASLIDDSGLLGRMAEAGRRRMQNEFSITTMADKHEALYESVLNGT
ncbi:MAG: glycosyltransferase family 4 protein, partial [Woeseiaceae bacterium]